MDEQRARSPAAAEEAAAQVESLVRNLARVVHAPGETLRRVAYCLLAEGHLIIEDYPGVGKTMLAKALARSLDVRFSRLQFTPDLLPSDVTGVNVFDQVTNAFEFRPGPVFANVLLVDEVNRASPKTQAALLECMQEDQVTVDGVSYPLTRPFMVLATQNPIEYEGTFPLPEAQLDRFLVKTALGYPDAEDEGRIVEEQLAGHPLGRLTPVIDLDDIATLRRAVADVFLHEAVARWMVDLVRATRELPLVAIGASVRGTLALNRMARAWALLHQRRYVTPDDVEQLFVSVLLHRILFRPSFLAEIRDRGWEAASLEVRGRCLEVAPKPGFDIDLDVPATAA
jgi:MoxR-like ATPase